KSHEETEDHTGSTAETALPKDVVTGAIRQASDNKPNRRAHDHANSDKSPQPRKHITNEVVLDAIAKHGSFPLPQRNSAPGHKAVGDRKPLASTAMMSFHDGLKNRRESHDRELLSE